MTNFNQSPNQSPNITGSRFSTAVSRVSELIDRVRLGRIEGNIIEKQDEIQNLNKDIHVRSKIAEASGEDNQSVNQDIMDNLRPLTKSQLKFRRKMDTNFRLRLEEGAKIAGITDIYDGVADKFSGNPGYINPKIDAEKAALMAKAKIVSRNALINGDPSLENHLDTVNRNPSLNTNSVRDNIRASMENPLIAGKKGIKPHQRNEKFLDHAEHTADKIYKNVRDYKIGLGRKQISSKRKIAKRNMKINRLEQKAIAIRARRP
jgi:hypothetical protein